MLFWHSDPPKREKLTVSIFAVTAASSYPRTFLKIEKNFFWTEAYGGALICIRFCTHHIRLLLQCRRYSSPAASKTPNPFGKILLEVSTSMILAKSQCFRFLACALRSRRVLRIEYFECRNPLIISPIAVNVQAEAPESRKFFRKNL